MYLAYENLLIFPGVVPLHMKQTSKETIVLGHFVAYIYLLAFCFTGLLLHHSLSTISWKAKNQDRKETTQTSALDGVIYARN